MKNWPTMPFNEDLRQKALETLDQVLQASEDGFFDPEITNRGRLALDTLLRMEAPSDGQG